MKNRTFDEINEIYKNHVNEHKTISELSREYRFNPTYQFKKYGLEIFNWWKKDLKKRRELYLCIETPPYIYRESIINFRKHLPNNNNNILLWCNA